MLIVVMNAALLCRNTQTQKGRQNDFVCGKMVTFSREKATTLFSFFLFFFNYLDSDVYRGMKGEHCLPVSKCN